MNNNFKITNMVFDYSSNPMMVNTNFTVEFENGDSVAGKISLTIEEFNSNTEGLTGYSKMIKDKLVADFEGLIASK